jgi:hypothetical protein
VILTKNAAKKLSLSNIFLHLDSLIIMKKNSQNKITRKEALKRMGKYAALTAAGTFLILTPAKAAQSSVTTPPPPDGDPFGTG